MNNKDIVSDRQALTALVVDNSDLERLEALLDQFNIFEALGAVRVELRHSDFLAFLLNPKQSHRLGQPSPIADQPGSGGEEPDIG